MRCVILAALIVFATAAKAEKVNEHHSPRGE